MPRGGQRGVERDGKPTESCVCSRRWAVSPQCTEPCRKRSEPSAGECVWGGGGGRCRSKVRALVPRLLVGTRPGQQAQQRYAHPWGHHDCQPRAPCGLTSPPQPHALPGTGSAGPCSSQHIRGETLVSPPCPCLGFDRPYLGSALNFTEKWTPESPCPCSSPRFPDTSTSFAPSTD